MLTDIPPQTDQPAAARGRVCVGDVPDWVKPEDTASTEPTKSNNRADHLTYLFVDRQVHAERRQTYCQVRVRLESMQAVQHESQWRLQIDPATQSLILHGIRIHRGTEEIDHTRLEKIRFLEREDGLETFVLDGRCTLLLVLDDVRPGDVLEWCYTMEHHPRVLPEYCTCLFALPPSSPVLRYRFSVLFDETRAMKWKASPGQTKPTESRDSELSFWRWTGEDYAGQKPEPNTPEWHLGFPWIQISECPDWNTVAAAVTRAWSSSEDPLLDEIVQDIAAKHADPLAKVTSALDFVQNEFRYLSLNLDLGAQIPAAPGIVARRRFGDCKDLSWLLVQLLKRLHVKARPILVNAAWGTAIDQALPTLEVFNHAVVEFQIDGATRWIDPTMKHQGGTALERFIPNFRCGLPVDPDSAALVSAPALPEGSGLYEVNETLLLDTNRAPSLLGVVCRTRGLHAEILRRDFAVRGADEIARERLQFQVSRFGQASRIGALQHRDDREANEFVFAEVFEINGFLAFDPQNQLCLLRFPNAFLPSPLPPPDSAPRHSPYALPHPCELVYTVELEAANLGPMAQPRCRLDNEFFQFTRRERSLHRFWALTFTLSTLRDAVLPAQMDDYRKAVERLCRECYWELYLPSGYARPRQGRNFGHLPDPPFRRAPRAEPQARATAAPGAGRTASIEPELAAASGAALTAEHRAPMAPDAVAGVAAMAQPAIATASTTDARPISYVDPRPRRGDSRRRRKRHRRSTPPKVYYLAGGVLLLFIVLVLLVAAAR